MEEKKFEKPRRDEKMWGDATFLQARYEKVSDLPTPQELDDLYKAEEWEKLGEVLKCDFFAWGRELTKKIEEKVGEKELSTEEPWKSLSDEDLASVKKLVEELGFFKKHDIQISEDEEILAAMSLKNEDSRKRFNDALEKISKKHEARLLATKSLFIIRSELALFPKIIADPKEARQPCGVEIVKKATERNLPVVIVTGHHAEGEELTLSFISSYLRQKGIINDGVYFEMKGRVRRQGRDADLFIMWKELNYDWKRDIVNSNWAEVFKRLKEKILERDRDKTKFRLLIVDDNPEVVKTIEQFLDEKLKGEVDPQFVNDCISAETELKKEKYDGVISDMFFPFQTGSGDKSLGEKIYLDVLSPLIGEDDAQELLSEAKEHRKEFEDATKEAYQKLSNLWRK